MPSAKACNLRADKATRQSFCGHQIAEVFINGEIYMSPFFKCRVFNNKIHFRRQGTSWCDIFDDWITFCCLACLSNLIYACPSSSMPACAWCQLLSSDLHTIFSVFACKAKCAVGTRPLGLFYTFQLSKNIWRCVPNPWVLLGFRSADPKLVNPPQPLEEMRCDPSIARPPLSSTLACRLPMVAL